VSDWIILFRSIWMFAYLCIVVSLFLNFFFQVHLGSLGRIADSYIPGVTPGLAKR
jgi:hypothetical protein